MHWGIIHLFKYFLSFSFKQGEGTFVEWRPSSGFTPLEYEVHPVFSGSIEYGVVTTQEPQPSKIFTLISNFK